VISPAVLGFLISFNAREMCSLRRRLKFGIFFIAGFTVSKDLNQLNPPVLCSAKRQLAPSLVDRRVLAGSSLGCTDGPVKFVLWFFANLCREGGERL
jgi:hypothetical protein